MSNLRNIMREEVMQRGIISFERFMELALYCPNFGYYERLDVSPGQAGDFFTSVSVGSLFGELLANQFAEWLGELPVPRSQIVEAGAHDGKLALDILSWFQTHRASEFASLQYWIIEPSAQRREMQKLTLKKYAANVSWFESWEALPVEGVTGIIFSNELLDAMPVKRLGWDATTKTWFEWGVVFRAEEFVWARMEGVREFNAGTTTWFPSKELLEVLPDGFSTEIGPAAMDWWRQAARALKQGKLVAFDYGLTADQFFTPERKSGTLRAYHRHHANNELLARIGKQDITAQVNFTAISETGEAEGLKTDGLVTQAQFLIDVVKKMSGRDASFAEWISKRTREFQTLTHPEHLGQSFRVLVQHR